jgi:hypothetical protein
MSSWRTAVAAVPVERRGSERSPIGCPAQLHLTIGIRVGSLWDLSETGARFQSEHPPRVGMEALIKWQSHEAFCKIVWVTGDMCGLAFDRPLSRMMLDESLKEEARRTGPVAAVSNIPLGQKRSRI